MTPLLGLVLFLAATGDPLPKELEYRLSLARALPAPYSGAVIVALLPSAKLTPGQITALAQEAYQLAGADSSVALRAWIAYRDNFDKETDVALGFPIRGASAKAGCADLEVSDPKDYYRWALQAGEREFQIATRNARSAVEVGRIAEAILEGGGEQHLGLLGRMLQNANGSDREFIEAIRYTGLHNAILKLVQQLPQRPARNLLNQYRGFLVANLAGRRCAGNRSEEFEGLFVEFNRLAFRLGAVAPLEPEDARVTSVDPVTRDLLPNPFALAHKLENAPADETAVRSMLTEIGQFQLEQKPGTATSTEEAKAYLYGRLAERLETNRYLPRAMEEWVHFVVYSRLREQSPRVWFRSARRFYEWARGNPYRMAMVEQAGDPALSAYIKLTALLPESEVARVLP